MIKQEAIEIVNNHLKALSLNNGNTNKELLLNTDNTNFANINSRESVWWFTIPLERFVNDLHLLLKKIDSFLWLKINANTIIPQDSFALRSSKDKIDLKISSNRQDNYMVDIRFDKVKYDFNPHFKHEFKCSNKSFQQAACTTVESSYYTSNHK